MCEYICSYTPCMWKPEFDFMTLGVFDLSSPLFFETVSNWTYFSYWLYLLARGPKVLIFAQQALNRLSLNSRVKILD